jgi:formiminotetrahydrofolate cyclodeaminase
MPETDPDRLLALLRDPNVASAEIAAAAGVTREDAGRAARLITTMARVQAEEAATLPAPLAAAVLRAAVAAGRVDLAVALAARPEKELSKDAKRLLHHLRARGVAVPELPRPAAPAPAPALAEPPPACYASTLDGSGERAVWLPRSLPGRGIEVAQAVLSDERGIVELQLGTLGRKEWRAFVKGLLQRGAEMGVAEIERERAHALVAAARSLNGPSGTRLPDGADLWLTQLGPAPALPRPGAGLPALLPEEEAAALAGSAALHALPLLRGWLADPAFLREAARRLDESAASPLELTPEQRLERQRALLQASAEAYLTPERRARLADRLLDVAEHLGRSGQAEPSRAAAAAGRALAAGRPAAEIPFALGLVEKAFPRGPAPAGAPFDPPLPPR